MKYFLIAVFLIVFSGISNAQNKQTKFANKFDDVMEEDENQNLTLRFFNALTGETVEGATVTIEGLEPAETDEEGKIRFPVPEDDGVLQVHFECPKYITCDFPVEVIAGTLFFNRFSVSPVLDLKDLRMVLDWEQTPPDLDAHFVKENSYHLSYHFTKVLADGRGELDRDDMDGYGPETITIHDVDDLANYEYFVHDYTDKANPSSTNLAGSKAAVKVYGEGRLLYVFQVPQRGTGNTWSVFKISEGQFIETNQISN